MPDVSRETPPEPDPTVVARVFAPDRVDVLERYAALLASQGVLRGLIGPREVPRLWDRHLLNCGLLAPLVPEGARVADLGSGAGLPGLVLALARPDLAVTLIEPMARRSAFLEEACATLDVDNVTVVRGRAEAWSGPESFDVVTARALAPLARLVTWGLPLVAAGGVLLAMKGSSAEQEIHDAGDELARWRAEPEIVRTEVPGATGLTVVRVVPRGGPAIGWQPTSTARRRRRERR